MLLTLYMPMKSNKKNISEHTNKPVTNQNSPDTPTTHTYRLLGESGLVEDEEGNIYNASDISDPYSLTKERVATPTFTSYVTPSSDMPGRSNEPDWAAIYDPRYCGPSREDYINRMHSEYIAKKTGGNRKRKKRSVPTNDIVRTPVKAFTKVTAPTREIDFAQVNVPTKVTTPAKVTAPVENTPEKTTQDITVSPRIEKKNEPLENGYQKSYSYNSNYNTQIPDNNHLPLRSKIIQRIFIFAFLVILFIIIRKLMHEIINLF